MLPALVPTAEASGQRKRSSCTRRFDRTKKLVCLVGLVYLVYLVRLVCLVFWLNASHQMNKIDQTNQTDQATVFGCGLTSFYWEVFHEFLGKERGLEHPTYAG